ncbi:Enoyl-CoA hydratase [Labilithrix luteola]|uniref:Enoyl-CoA hydratase n=1 Tax=Labilithrix luteola TaxID=1391654 RepID=A0A0K1PKK0_9BACT|nr:enoyl-CoA hydratase [Labilithrix luteola]AKU93921.1 Enoyl-CoA hydratase [Labilithrix luteola]
MSDIKISRNGSMLEIALDRPKKKNALTFAMYGALTEALKSANEDGGVRVVLLSGEGDSFCAGNDIGDFLSSPGLDPVTAPPMLFIDALIRFDKPLVAAVQGAAVGIGTTMLLHADLVYADDTAKFSVPFVGLGLVPEAASSVLLPRRIGQAAANDMLLRSSVVSAKRAVELGLVNEIAPTSEGLLAFARSRAEEVASKPPRAVRATKALAGANREELLACARREAEQFATSIASEEAREAFQAFMERRAPDFSRFS